MLLILLRLLLRGRWPWRLCRSRLRGLWRWLWLLLLWGPLLLLLLRCHLRLWRLLLRLTRLFRVCWSRGLLNIGGRGAGPEIRVLSGCWYVGRARPGVSRSGSRSRRRCCWAGPWWTQQSCVVRPRRRRSPNRNRVSGPGWNLQRSGAAKQNSKVHCQKEKSKYSQTYKVYAGERGILLLGDWALAALHYSLGVVFLLRGTGSAGCPSSTRCSRWAFPSLSLGRSHGGGIHLLHLDVRVS